MTTRAEKPLISIVVPVYNELANIEPLYEAVNKTLSSVADEYDWELIFTDNHSNDGSWDVISALAKRDPRCRGFRFSRNFGFQRSILTGYRMARGDAAVQLDCDLQDSPDVILEFLKLWRANFKVVYGIRRNRPEGRVLTLLRQRFYRLLDLLSDHKLPHDAGDFRLIDKCIVEQLKAYDDEHPYIRGYIATLGFPQVGVIYDRSERRFGQSKFNLKRLIELGLDAIVTHSLLPLRFASAVGVLVFVLSLVGAAFYAVLRFAMGPEKWPAGLASVVILVSLSTALNALFLGIMGEYIGRIFMQVKRRPLTIVEATAPIFQQKNLLETQPPLDLKNAIVIVASQNDNSDSPGDTSSTK